MFQTCQSSMCSGMGSSFEQALGNRYRTRSNWGGYDDVSSPGSQPNDTMPGVPLTYGAILSISVLANVTATPQFFWYTGSTVYPWPFASSATFDKRSLVQLGSISPVRKPGDAVQDGDIITVYFITAVGESGDYLRRGTDFSDTPVGVGVPAQPSDGPIENLTIHIQGNVPADHIVRQGMQVYFTDATIYAGEGILWSFNPSIGNILGFHYKDGVGANPFIFFNNTGGVDTLQCQNSSQCQPPATCVNGTCVSPPSPPSPSPPSPSPPSPSPPSPSPPSPSPPSPPSPSPPSPSPSPPSPSSSRSKMWLGLGLAAIVIIALFMVTRHSSKSKK